jgi:hypothetical protein
MTISVVILIMNLLFKKKFILITFIILNILQTNIFAIVETDGNASFNFKPLNNVIVEKITIARNSNYLDTPEGEIIGFKVGTLTIMNNNSFKKTRISFSNFQNYKATIKSIKNNLSTGYITTKSSMTLVCKSVVYSNGQTGGIRWYKLDGSQAKSQTKYCEIGDFENFQRADIDFYFLIDNTDVLFNYNNFEITVSHNYDEQARLGDNPSIFMNYYDTSYDPDNSFYHDDQSINQTTTTINIEKDYITHYIEENSHLAISVIKLYEEDDTNKFFNGKLIDYYKLSFSSTIGNKDTSNPFEIGIQMASANNFKLFKIGDNGKFDVNKGIPYKIYLKKTNGSYSSFITNGERFLLKNINKNQSAASKNIYISTRCNQPDKKISGGDYIDYLYINFYTDDYNISDYSIIDLSN